MAESNDNFFVELGKKIWIILPTLRRTSPQWAAAIGFVFGGIGLAIYFRSFVDFIAPIAIAIVAIILVGEVGWLAGAIIAAIYGFSRSHDSNRRLDEAEASPAVPVSLKPS
jgi:hypothetical protein